MKKAVVPAVPADRDALLAQLPPERRRIHDMVRSTLDELEAAAPWRGLYDPPDDLAEFAALLARLVELVDAVPDRVAALLRELDDGGHDFEDIEFFFAGIHQMAERDLAKLRQRLGDIERGGAVLLSPAERDATCEVGADLKGKYASSLMGATASIVAEGLWPGVDVEPVLFPEKAEEFARNEALVVSLREIQTVLGRLHDSVDFTDILARWRNGKRVDPYALIDLTALRAALGRLLQQHHRRALYSGDYRQIRRRERVLSRRLNELEELQEATWAAAQTAPTPAQYARLVALLCEVAAIVDVELLGRLVGERQVRDLRQLATAELEEEKRRGGEPELEADAEERRRQHPRRQRLTAELAGVPSLLHAEDLQTFFDLLLGAVMKRASLALRQLTPAAAPAVPASLADELLSSIEEGVSAAPVVAAPVRPPAPARPVAARPPRIAAAAPTASLAPLGPLERQALGQLRHLLENLRAPDNADWNTFRMIQRLLQKHGVVPPAMLHGLHPYVHQLLNELIPQLELVHETGIAPPGTVQVLLRACTEISRRDLSLQQIRSGLPPHFDHVARLLDALDAAAARRLAG